MKYYVSFNVRYEIKLFLLQKFIPFDYRRNFRLRLGKDVMIWQKERNMAGNALLENRRTSAIIKA